MPRPDPSLLDPARYSFHCEIAPRFGDLDINMHVNNVALCGLLEEGRVQFHRAIGYLRAARGGSSLVASFAVEYLGEVLYPAPLQLHAAMRSIGRTSHVVAQLAIQEGRPAAYAEAVIVTVADGRPAPHGQEFAATMHSWMLRA